MDTTIGTSTTSASCDFTGLAEAQMDSSGPSSSYVTTASIHARLKSASRVCISEGCDTILKPGHKMSRCVACSIKQMKRDDAAAAGAQRAEEDTSLGWGDKDRVQEIPDGLEGLSLSAFAPTVSLKGDTSADGSMLFAPAARTNAKGVEPSTSSLPQEEATMRSEGRSTRKVKEGSAIQEASSALPASNKTALGSKRKAIVIKHSASELCTIPNSLSRKVAVPSEKSPLPPPPHPDAARSSKPNPNSNQDIHALLRSFASQSKSTRPPSHSLIRLCKRRGCAAILTPNKDGAGAVYCKTCRDYGLVPPREIRHEKVSGQSIVVPPVVVPTMMERTTSSSSSASSCSSKTLVEDFSGAASVPKGKKRKCVVPDAAHARLGSPIPIPAPPASSSLSPVIQHAVPDFLVSHRENNRGKEKDTMERRPMPESPETIIRRNSAPASVGIGAWLFASQPVPRFRPRLHSHKENPYPIPPFYEPAPISWQVPPVPATLISGGKPVLLDKQAGERRKAMVRRVEEREKEKDERGDRGSHGSPSGVSGFVDHESEAQTAVASRRPADDGEDAMVVDREPGAEKRAEEGGEGARKEVITGETDLVAAVGKAVSDVLSGIATSHTHGSKKAGAAMEDFIELELEYPASQATSHLPSPSPEGEDLHGTTEVAQRSEGEEEMIDSTERSGDGRTLIKPSQIVPSQAQRSGLTPLMNVHGQHRKVNNIPSQVQKTNLTSFMNAHDQNRGAKHNLHRIPPGAADENEPHPPSLPDHIIHPRNSFNHLSHSYRPPFSHPHSDSAHPPFTCEPLVPSIARSRLPTNAQRPRRNNEPDRARIEAMARTRAESHANTNLTGNVNHEDAGKVASAEGTSREPPKALASAVSEHTHHEETSTLSEFAQHPVARNSNPVFTSEHCNEGVRRASAVAPSILDIRPAFIPKACSTPECNGIIKPDSASRRCIGCIMRRWRDRDTYGGERSFDDGEGASSDFKQKRKSVTWADWCGEELHDEKREESEDEEEAEQIVGWDSDLSELTESGDDVDENDGKGDPDRSSVSKRKSMDEGDAEKIRKGLKLIFKPGRMQVDIVGHGVNKQVPFNPSKFSPLRSGSGDNVDIEMGGCDDDETEDEDSECRGLNSDEESHSSELSSEDEPLGQRSCMDSSSTTASPSSTPTCTSGGAEASALAASSSPTACQGDDPIAKENRSTSADMLASTKPIPSPMICIPPASSLPPTTEPSSSLAATSAPEKSASYYRQLRSPIPDVPPEGFSNIRCTIQRCGRFLPLHYTWKCCPRCRLHHREYQRKRLGCEAKYRERGDEMSPVPVDPARMPVVGTVSLTNAFSKGLLGSYKLVDPDGFLADGARVCTIRGCRHVIPDVLEYKWKLCFPCRVRTTRNRRIREARAERLARAAQGLPEDSDEEPVDRLLSSSPDADLPKQDPERARKGRCVNTDCGMRVISNNTVSCADEDMSDDFESGALRICEQCEWRKLPPEEKKIHTAAVHKRVQLLPIRDSPSPAPTSTIPNTSLPRKSSLRQTVFPIPPPKPCQPTPYPEYQSLSRLLMDFQRLLHHFFEAQMQYYLHTQQTAAAPPVSKSKFGFDGEYSAVARNFDIMERKEEVEQTVEDVLQEMERVVQLKFHADSRVSASTHGGLVTRLTCIHRVAVLAPAGANANTGHRSRMLSKDMTGELEIVVLPVNSHRYLPGQRTVVRFRLIG